MTTDTDLLRSHYRSSRRLWRKPIIRDMRIAVEHILGMLAAGDSPDTILQAYPLLEAEDIQACPLLAHRSLAGEYVHERVLIR